jgi:hypothetical protein
MSPPGTRACDWLGETLALNVETLGIEGTLTAIGDGTIEVFEEDQFERPVSDVEWQEGEYRGTDEYWETFSRNRLIEQQLEVLETFRPQMEEVWLRSDVLYADCLVDVGAGWGGMLWHLVEYAPRDALIIALDSSYLALKTLLGRMIRGGITNVLPLVGDIGRPPVATDMADAVVSWYGLGATPFFSRATSGVAEILAPGRPMAFAGSPVLEDFAREIDDDLLKNVSLKLDMPRDSRQMLESIHQAGFIDGELLEGDPFSIISARLPVRGG